MKSFGKSWKTVFSYFLKYKKDVITLSILGVFSAIGNGAVPFVVGKFFDSVLSPDKAYSFVGFTFATWIFFLSLWFITQVVANGSDYIIDKMRRRLATHMEALFITDAVLHVLSLPVSFHKENRHGDTWDRLMRARSALYRIIENIIIQVPPQLLSVFIGLAFAFFIHPVLATVLVVGVSVYVITLLKVVAPIVTLQKEGHELWSKAYGDAYDVLANYETIKQATAESFEAKRLRNMFTQKAFGVWYKVEKIWANISFYQRSVVLLTQLIVFVLSVFYIQNGSISIGDLIALNGYAAMIFAPFTTLGYNWEAVQNGLVAIERSEEILANKRENDRPGLLTPRISGKVVFKDVSFGYSKKITLEGLSFDINPGEVVAFVGESGVGKSTAISLISGYYFPSKGEVLMNDVSTKDIDLVHLRRSIAVVPQEVVLFNDTIEANIKYGNPNASEDQVNSAVKKAHLEKVVAKFPDGYKQLVGERGIKLSVGEKQRVAIARAILRNPQILILDEPTSALDVRTEKVISKSLGDLMQGRTTFIIAHRLSTVRRADRILVFDQGKVVEAGTHEELILKEGGVYQKLHNLHIGLHD